MAGALAGLYIGSVFPFVTRTAKDLHATDAALAWISAAPFLGNLLSPLWAAQMVGRAKMPFCVWGWSAARALFLLMPFVTAPWPFALLMVSIQVLGTMPSPAYAALMKDLYPDETRGRLMGYVRATVQTTTLLGTLIAGRLLDNQLSFRTLFPAAALSGIAAALVFSRCKTATPLPDSSGQQRPSLRETLLPLVENPPFRWFALSVMFYGLGNLMAQPLYALFQIERLGVRNTDIADIANAAALSAIGGSFLWGRFLDRYGAARTVFFAICLVTSTSVVYFFARTLAPLYLASALFGFGLSGIELSYMASILAYAEPGQTARYQSLHSLLLGIRGILAPLIALPLLRWAGWQATFAITFGLMLIGAVLQFLAMRKER
jgi:MFS family permease